MKQTSYHQDASAFDPNTIDTLINPIRPAIRDAVAKMVQEEITVAVQNAIAAVSPHAAQVDAFHRAITVRSASAPYVRSAKGAGKKKCSEAGCSEPARCKGLCSAHYQAARRRAAAATQKRAVKKPVKVAKKINKKPMKKAAAKPAAKPVKKPAKAPTKKAKKPVEKKVETKPAEA